jgi:hypothetical protein
LKPISGQSKTGLNRFNPDYPARFSPPLKSYGEAGIGRCSLHRRGFIQHYRDMSIYELKYVQQSTKFSLEVLFHGSPSIPTSTIGILKKVLDFALIFMYI